MSVFVFSTNINGIILFSFSSLSLSSSNDTSDTSCVVTITTLFRLSDVSSNIFILSSKRDITLSVPLYCLSCTADIDKSKSSVKLSSSVVRIE